MSLMPDHSHQQKKTYCQRQIILINKKTYCQCRSFSSTKKHIVNADHSHQQKNM